MQTKPKMKIAIICSDYPSQNSHAFNFVHARAKVYQANMLDVKIFVPASENYTDNFENISILRLNKKELNKEINLYKPDVLAIHFATYKLIPIVDKLNYPKILWLHGHEILWLFSVGKSKNIFDYFKKRILLIPRELFQLLYIRSFVDRVEFNVFVSKWMHRSAQKSILKKIINCEIIPNPVDTNLFSYNKPKNINKGISVRSLSNTKYGLDIAIKAFQNIQNNSLNIVGTGRLYEKFVRLVKNTNSKTEIINKSFNHNSLPNLYASYGYFVAPSRVEAQGVAMCEAMSCGLPVIATNVGGIPEFVREGIDGYLVSRDNPDEMQKAILKLTNNPELFQKMSRNARKRILDICSEKEIFKKELEIMNRAITKYKEKK